VKKNKPSQVWTVFAFNRNTNTPHAGDAANITAKLSIDGAAAVATNDVNPLELEDGYYVFSLTQAETNGDNILILPESTTSSIQVIGSPSSVSTNIEDDINTSLTSVAGEVTSVLADTNELQTNQGQWLTATGFNTVAPDNASIAAILVDTADLQANQGQWLTATGFNTIAPDNASIAAILVDTADLQANQGQWLTATGFNTVAPDNAGITANGVAVAALNDPTAAAIADAVWDESQAGHVIAGSFGEYLDAKVSLAGGCSLPVTDFVHGLWDEAQSSHVTVGTFG